MRVLTFDQFRAQRGIGALPYGEDLQAYPRWPSGIGLRGANVEMLRRCLEHKRLLAEAHRDYDRLVVAGEIRVPTSMERMERAAAGSPDNARTQAARRVLARRLARMKGRENDGKRKESEKAAHFDKGQ